jgi:hypothetical protein
MAPNDARFQKWDVILRVLNTVVQWLNGKIQGQRQDAAWAARETEVKDHLQKNPTHGALILVYYSSRRKGGGEKETPLQHTNLFNDFVIGYGRTEEEALANIKPSDIGYHVGAIPGHVIDKANRKWIQPLQPVSILPATGSDYTRIDYESIPTPLSKWGLGTFVPGREEVTRVKFSRAMGFDDKTFSVEQVNMKALTARFIILDAPRQIEYIADGKRTTTSLKLDLTPPGQVDDPQLKGFEVPVIDLDSAINPYDAEVAMVYPADKFTLFAFERTKAIDAGGLILVSGNFMKYVRYVKPEKIRLLRVFDVDDSNRATAASDEAAVNREFFGDKTERRRYGGSVVK